MGTYYSKCMMRSFTDVADAPRVTSARASKVMRVVSVYDGDTITVLTRGIDGRHVKWNCRMLGYDSPELKSSNDAEKEAAVQAREFLKTILPVDHVFVGDVHGLDKYGRLLLDYRHKGRPIADVMISAKHGVAYHGGKKHATTLPVNDSKK